MQGRHGVTALAALAIAVVVGDAAVAATGAFRQRGPSAVQARVQSAAAPVGRVPVPVATVRVPPAAVPAVPAVPVVPAVPAVPAVAVRPLTTLISPDLLVTGPVVVSAEQLAAVKALVGVSSVVPVSAGPVRVGSTSVLALGADPSVFRTVTPAPTAASDPLWRSVARGDLLATYATARALHLTLGKPTTVDGAPLRVGSFADLRMPGVGAFVDPAVARRLHLVPEAGLVVTAPSRDVVGLETEIVKILRPEQTATEILRLTLPTSGHATMSEALYKAAARTCPGLSWSVLAAIGGIESDHGADTAISSAGAEGPMQFLPATFAQYAVDGDGDGQALIDDPADAVFTAARLLCDDGAGAGGHALYAAIFAYNHADWYVAAVESLAARYAAA